MMLKKQTKTKERINKGLIRMISFMAMLLCSIAGLAENEMTRTYLLKNVETGKYLNKGNLYGMQAVLADDALPVQLTQQSDGSYTIYFPYGSQHQQLLYRASQDGVYVDYNEEFENACPYWTITNIGDGNYRIQSLTTHPTYGQTAMPDTYLGNNSTLDPYNNVDGNVAVNKNITWQLEEVTSRTAAQVSQLQTLVAEALPLGIGTSEEVALLENANASYIEMFGAIFSLQNRVNEERNRIPECIVIPWGRIQGWEMKYYEPVNGEPDDSWTTKNFDDSSWPTLTGPIANEDVFLGVNTNTFWNNEQRSRYYLRSTFELGEVNENGYHFSSRHDDHIKVWINGTEVIDAGFFNGKDQHYHIPASAFKSGTNTLAILVEDFGLGAYLDYSLGNYFFLKNVDADKYLNMGNNYGTQAVLADDALPVQLTKKNDGSYTFYFPYVGERQLLFRDTEQDVFVDYAGQETGCPYWTITHIGSGNYHIQSLTTHPTYGQTAMSGTYLGNNPTLDPNNNVDGNVYNAAGMNITWKLEPVYARTEAQMTRLGELITTAQGLGLNTEDEEEKSVNVATTYMEMLATINYLQDRINDETDRINRINNKVQDLNKLIACANAVGVNTEAAQAVADNPANMEAVTNAISTLRTAYMTKLSEGVSASLLPLDVTGAIVNPSFTNDSNEGWTWGENEEPTGMGYHNVEYRERTFNFHQTISGLPDGYYILKVKGFHRPGNKDAVFADYMQDINNAKAELYGNNQRVTLKNVAAEAQETEVDGWSGIEVNYNDQRRFIPHTDDDARTWFNAGYYENELPVTITDGTLTLGVRLAESVTDDWVNFDDFRLVYIDSDVAIEFADNNVKAICVAANWDINKDGELSRSEAAAVTDLGEVFKGNTDITSFNELQYFKGLTEIGGYAFEGCSNLASVIFPEGLQTIGRYAFHESGLNSISFPATLTEVGEWAFSDCHSLTSIDFSGCSATFNSFCFAGCSMESLYIPNTISIVGMQHFIFCTSLQTVEFQEGYDCSAHTMFWHCTNLETVILPTTKVFGWSGWFLECPKINTVTFLDAAENEGFWDYNHQFDLSDPSSCRFVIPEGKAEIFLRKGYMNLSDLSGLPLVVEEFESEAARITAMANTFNSGDKEALSNAISTARTIVNAAEDYLTVYAQIAAIKSAAKNFLASATLSENLDVTAAYITNPDFDRFAIGWELPMSMDAIGYNPVNYTNENSQIDHFAQARSYSSALDNGHNDKGQFLQTITNLPAGIYRLECDAIATWSQDASVEVTGVSLFAGSQTKAMATENEHPQHFTLSFDNHTPKDVNIGVILKNTNANWVAFDNFRLIYEGPVAAVPEGTELVSSEDATYYIYNVDTGMYLNGGNGWGIQAVLAETGLPVRMTQDGDGYWQVYFREGSRNQQLLFKDQSGNILTDYNDNENSQYKWIVTESDGSYTIQSVGDSGSDYVLGNDPTRQDKDLNGDITLDTHIDVIRTDNATNNTRWKFIKKADYDILMAKRYLLSTIFRMENSDADNEELLNSAQAVYDNDESTYDEVVAVTTLLNSQMGMPQENQPVDMTALIINPRFEYNTSEGWTGAKLTSTGNANNTQSQTHEFYETSFNMFQTITGVPNGLYRLKWKGFHRPGYWESVCDEFVNGTNNASAVVYANSVAKTMKHIYSGASDTKLDVYDHYYSDAGKYIPDMQCGARAYFDEGIYADYLEVEVTDNVLTIGVKNTQEMGGEHWVIFSDFELEILQNAETYNNHMSANNVSSVPGGSATLPIQLANTDQIVSFTVDVRLPEGVVPKTDNSGNIIVKKASRVPMTVMGSVLNDGTCRFAALTNGEAISGNSGDIFSFVILPAGNMELGEYQVRVDNIKLVNDQLLRIQPFGTTSTLTLNEAASGDVNGDNDVDITDATIIVYYVLGRNPAINLDAGDINGDGDVDILDATIIVYHILGRDTNPAAAARKLALPEPQ